MKTSDPVHGTADPTMSVAVLRGLLSGVMARGMAVRPYLDRVGLPPDVLERPDYDGISTGQYIEVFHAIARDLQDESLGMLSRPFKVGSFALIAKVGMGGANLREALRRMAHTTNLLQDDLHFALVENGAGAGLQMRWLHANRAPQAFILYTLMRVFWRLSHWLIGGALRIQYFEFSVPEDEEGQSYAVAFPGQRYYGRPACGFHFDAALLARPVISDDMALRAFLSDSLTRIIVPPRLKGQASMAVRTILMRAYPHWPGVHEVAQQMHTSRATLQRQLAAEGNSLQRIKDSLRCDLAISRLSTSPDSLAEIALELGFSDSAAFQRAFKQWTGKTCGAYRTRL